MRQNLEIMENLNFRLINGQICDNSLITLSWGIHDLVFSQNEITFKVNGIKFSGKVSIKSAGNGLLGLSLSNDSVSYTLISTLPDMINELDGIIESGENYDETLSD